MFNVAIVDSDSDACRALSLLLTRLGWQVETFSSGTEARAALAHSPAVVDCVITDMGLSDMPGADLVRQLRATVGTARFVAMASRVLISDVGEIVRAGVDDFLEKPITEQALACVVDRLQQSRANSGSPLHLLAPSADDHAAIRWATALVVVIRSAHDPKTIRGWAECALASTGALRNWCRTMNIPARTSLLFARLARAVLRHQAFGERPEQTLNDVDTRTLRNLLAYCGTPPGSHELPATLEEFVQRQTLINSPDAIRAFRVALASVSARTAPTAPHARHVGSSTVEGHRLSAASGRDTAADKG